MDTKKIDTEKLTQTFKNLKTQIFKSEALRIGAAVFFGLILLLSLLPYLLDNSTLKFHIAQKVSQISGANFAINGRVRVKLLPAPTIIIEDAILQNYGLNAKENSTTNSRKIYNLYAKSVQIKLPVFKFSHDYFAKKIILTDVILESHDAGNQSPRQDKFSEILEGFSKNPPAKEATDLNSGLSAKFFAISDADPADLKNIAHITVQNGMVILYDHLGRKKEVTAINVQTKIGKTNIIANGDFNSEEIVSTFKLLAKFNSKSKKPDSFLEIISPISELNIKGNFTSENRGILSSDFHGEIDGEAAELKSFYKTYVSANSVIFNKLEYNAQPIKISAKLNNNSQEITINDLVINSAVVSGKGGAIISLANGIPLVDINLDLDIFDLDRIWSDAAVAAPAPLENLNEIKNTHDDQMAGVVLAPPSTTAPKSEISKLLTPEGESIKSSKIEPINFDFTNRIKDFDLNAEIRIANVKYLEGEITDVDLYLTVSSHGEILILPMIFKIPGGGILRVNGALDNTAELPKFVGKLDIAGTSLKDVFKWLKIESQNLKFENLKQYNLYSDLLLLPNSVTFDNFYLSLNNGSSEFLGELKIDNNNKSPVISSQFQTNKFNIDDYFLISGQNAYLSPGLLVKKLLWLNNISSDNDLSLKFDNLTYKGEEFLDQSVKLRFGRGYIEIIDLNLKSLTTDLKANLAMDVSDKKLKFGLDISGSTFHYETQQPNKPSGKTNVATLKKRNFLDQFFALPSLEGFSGKISLNLNNLKLDDLQLYNVKLVGKLDDGEIDDANLECDLYDGKLEYKGLIGMRLNKVINGNLSFNNASLQPLLSDTVGIKNVSGVANISANVTASANGREEFAKNLVSEIKFNANAPTVEGYGLNDLVKKMFSSQQYRQELQNPEKILLNPESKTTFQQASGTIQINGSKEGRMRANITAPAINGILSGTVNVPNNTIDALFNTIFLTGNRQKQTPINIATNLKGNMDSISQSTNLDQAKQYLGLIKVENATSKIIPDPNLQSPTFQEKASSFLQDLIN